MSYDHGQRGIMIGVPGTPVPTQTPAIKAANTCFIFGRPIDVSFLCATITTAMTVTAAVVDFIYRPTPGSATGQVVLGRLTLPVTGSTIGHQVYKKITPVRCNPGGELVIELITASTAGAAAFGVVEGASAEFAANIAAMIASA